MKVKDIDKKIILLLDTRPLKGKEIVERMGAPRRTVYHRLKVLKGKGLVHQPRRGLWGLTDKGRAFLLHEGAPVGEYLGLKKVLALMPEGWQALVRLALSAVVAKRHLLGRFETGWPGFIVWGRTGLGKTFVGRMIGRILGLGDVVKDCRTATEGELLSRRVRLGGGRYAVKRSPYLDIPFLVLDEADKARGEVRRGVFQLLQGDAHILVEGEPVPHRMVPYVTLNLDRGPGEGFAPYLRRCVAVDFDGLGLDHKGVRAAVDRIPKPLPVLDPDRLSPPGELPRELRGLIEEVMRNCVGDGALWDRLPLEIMALGRAPFLGGDLKRAVLDTCYDRLVALETLKMTEPDWRTRVLAIYREHFPEMGAKGIAVVPSPKPQEKKEEELAFLRRKGGLLERVRAAIREATVPEGLSHHPAAQELAGVREELRELLREAEGVRDLGRLSWFERVVEERVKLVRELKGALREEEEARKRGTTRKREEWALKRARLRELERLIADCRNYYQRKRTRPDEDVLGTLLRLGCLEERKVQWEEEVTPRSEEALPLFLMGTGGSLAAAFVRTMRGEWERYPLRELILWQQEPGPRGQKARAILERLHKGDRSVRLEERYVLVRKSWGEVFVDTFMDGVNVMTKALPTKLVRQRWALIGPDGREYDPKELTRWDSPGVKKLLNLRLRELEMERELLKEELRGR